MNFDELYVETCTSVSVAAKMGNHDMLSVLLNKGKPTNIPDNKGWRALHHAVYNGHIDCVKLLLQASDADVHAVSFERETLLHMVCNPLLESDVQIKIASLLLNAGADPNAQNAEEFCSILNAAISNGSISLVKLLLKFGADVNGIDFQNGSSLDAAVTKGSLDIVEVLLKQDVKFTPHLPNTCLFFHKALSQGPNIPLLERLLMHPGCLPLINHQCDAGNTPLLIACSSGNEEAIELLLNYGADSNIRNGRSFLPLNLFLEAINDDSKVSKQSTVARVIHLTNNHELGKTMKDIPSSFFHTAALYEKKSILSYVLQELDQSLIGLDQLSSLPFDLSLSADCHISPLGLWCSTTEKLDMEMMHLLYYNIELVNSAKELATPPVLMPFVSRMLSVDKINRSRLIYRLMELGEDILTSHRISFLHPYRKLPEGSLPTAFLYAFHPECLDYLEFLLVQCVAASAVFNHTFFILLKNELCSSEFFLKSVSDQSKSRNLADHIYDVIYLVNNFVPKLPSSALEFLQEIMMSEYGVGNTVDLQELYGAIENPKSLIDLVRLEIRNLIWNANPKLPLWHSLDVLQRQCDLPDIYLNILRMK